MILKIGSRGSKLALIQANLVKSALNDSGVGSKIHTYSTSGDRNTSSPIYAIGKVGVFVEELNAKVEDRTFDAAVHSAKDIPSEISASLEVTAVLERASFQDALVSSYSLEDLPEGAVIGTSSKRRISELNAVRPDLIVKDIRGNIDTRLWKYRNGTYDGLIIARAALDRMEEEVTSFALSEDDFLPAPNQGIIAVVARKGSKESEILKKINHEKSFRSFTFERKLVSELRLGCSVPAGILCLSEKDASVLRARFYSLETNEHLEYSRKVETLEDVLSMADEIRKTLPKSYGYGFGV